MPRRRTPASPTSSPGWRWRGCASSGRPGPGGPTLRSPASAAPPASPAARCRSAWSAPRTCDLGYTSPPGIGNQISRRGGDRESGGTQINERSLRILAEDLRLRERAEAYLRFPAGPPERAHLPDHAGRGSGAGARDGRRTIFRPSSRWEATTTTSTSTGCPPAPPPGNRKRSSTWRPGAGSGTALENKWLAGEPPSGAAECGTLDPNAYVVCVGPYMVHLADPGINPPNLAAIQEISAGIYRVGTTVTLSTVSCGWTTSGSATR